MADARVGCVRLVREADPARMTDACEMLRDEHEGHEHQRRGPGLAVPVVVRARSRR